LQVLSQLNLGISFSPASDEIYLAIPNAWQHATPESNTCTLKPMDRLFFLKESRIRFAWLQIEVRVSYQMLNLRIMIVWPRISIMWTLQVTYSSYIYIYIERERERESRMLSQLILPSCMHILMQKVSSKLIFSVTRIDRKYYIRVYSRVNEKQKGSQKTRSLLYICKLRKLLHYFNTYTGIHRLENNNWWLSLKKLMDWVQEKII
jgi:hypothetical protein